MVGVPLCTNVPMCVRPSTQRYLIYALCALCRLRIYDR